MAGKKKPLGDSQENPMEGMGQDPLRGSGDTRRGGGARQPGETRGSGDTR
jgi:hypothetical protein